MWKQGKRQLISCILMSLVIYCLGSNSFAFNVIQPKFHHPSSPVTYSESLVLGSDEYPISLPIQQLGRCRTAFGLSSRVISSRDIFADMTRYNRIDSCCYQDNTYLNRLEEAELSGVISSLNTVFKVVNGDACQHMDVSPPSVSVSL